MENLAISYHAVKRHDEALKLRQDTLAGREALLGLNHPDTLRIMRELAVSLLQAQRDAEAVALIDECFKRGADKLTDPRVIPGVLVLRLKHFEKIKDAAGCRQTAEMWESLKRGDGDSLYAAAGMRAVTAAVIRAANPAAESNRAADAEAERAMHWLHAAVASGCDKVSNLGQDANFAALHDREDFRQLVAEVEANGVLKSHAPGGQQRPSKKK
jgi:hypothetical protein